MTLQEIEENLRKVANAISEEIKFYQRIWSLSPREKEKIKENDIKGLNEILQEKQLLIGEIDKIEKEIAPLRLQISQYSKERNLISKELLDSLKNLSAEITELVQKILNFEKNVLEEFSGKSEDVIKELQQISQSKKLKKTYQAKYKQKPPKFIDKKR